VLRHAEWPLPDRLSLVFGGVFRGRAGFRGDGNPGSEYGAVPATVDQAGARASGSYRNGGLRRILDVLLPAAAVAMCGALLLHLETWSLVVTGVLAAAGVLASWPACPSHTLLVPSSIAAASACIYPPHAHELGWFSRHPGQVASPTW
jgi:hypothetical protein